jgi:ppGpp synthetase/RelA/SpoT-type nucleotidyltranferase
MVRKSKKSSRTSPRNDFDEVKLREAYQDRSRLYFSLSDEVAFILDSSLRDADIKIHTIEHRVKCEDSLIAKAIRKNCENPLDDIKDIVGARIICLFRRFEEYRSDNQRNIYSSLL